MIVLSLAGLALFAANPETIFNEAAAALHSRNYAQAERGFQQVLKSQPNHLGALGNLGVIYSQIGRTADAVRIYRRALEIAPNDTKLQLNLGLAYLKQNKHGEAKPLFERLARVQPRDIRIAELLAVSQVHTGEAEKAVAALKSLPSSPSVLYTLGLAYLKLGQREEARKVLDESLPASMSPAQAAFLRGKAYYDGSVFEEALEQFETARKLDPLLPGLQLEIARTRISLRQWEEAERDLRTMPDNSEATYLLGAILTQQRRETEAIPLLESARARQPDAWGVYYYLGRAYLQAGDARKAVPLLEKAAELNADEAAVYYQLSRAYKASGRNEAARRAAAHVSAMKKESNAEGLILK